VQLTPDDPDSHINLANALQEHGHLAQARDASARLLALHPTDAQAWSIHVGLKTFAAADPELDRMEALLAVPAASDEAQRDNRIVLEFALGKAWMDVGDVDRAFEHLSRANRLKRETFDYDVRGDAQRLAAIPGGVDRLKPLLSGPGDPSELPIFVVGMPRSGTTLVEQILASHPDVSAGGELAAFHHAVSDSGLSRRRPQSAMRSVEPMTSFDPSTLGRAYLHRVAPLAKGKRRLVDKLPGNFEYIGLIALALPNARIIHCRRDPRDVGLSCYATRFVSAKPYAYDLLELGQYYRAYAGLMDRWRAALPPRQILDVQYEDIVADLEGETRRLLAFCGLPWDEACLRFHETRRPVRTASVNQVRRQLYGDSCGRWRAYESHLRPLIDALGEVS
jgi:tetratricopeptide (TPR) repeat protein